MNLKHLAATLLVAFSAAPLLAQMDMGGKNPNPTPSTVYVNPRSGPDDPRVGLKGGLYDAGVAASGMKLVKTLPKPAGFAPDVDSIKAYDAAPTPPPEPPPTPGAPRAPPRASWPPGQLRWNELRHRHER